MFALDKNFGTKGFAHGDAVSEVDETVGDFGLRFRAFQPITDVKIDGTNTTTVEKHLDKARMGPN